MLLPKLAFGHVGFLQFTISQHGHFQLQATTLYSPNTHFSYLALHSSILQFHWI